MRIVTDINLAGFFHNINEAIDGRNHKITFIKLVRGAMNTDLRTSKDLVEWYLENYFGSTSEYIEDGLTSIYKDGTWQNGHNLGDILREALAHKDDTSFGRETADEVVIKKTSRGMLQWAVMQKLPNSDDYRVIWNSTHADALAAMNTELVAAGGDRPAFIVHETDMFVPHKTVTFKRLD